MLDGLHLWYLLFLTLHDIYIIDVIPKLGDVDRQHIINIPIGEMKRFGKMSFATLYEPARRVLR